MVMLIARVAYIFKEREDTLEQELIFNSSKSC